MMHGNLIGGRITYDIFHRSSMFYVYLLLVYVPRTKYVQYVHMAVNLNCGFKNKKKYGAQKFH